VIDGRARLDGGVIGVMHTLVVGTTERVRTDFIGRLEQMSVAAIDARNDFSIAVAGGSVAELLLPASARVAIDWPHVDVFWCDERAVPPDHPDSNYGAAMDLLFAGPPASAATLHRMPADAPDLDTAARAYEATLRQKLAGAPLDLVLIGAGPDGHICSLFPGHQALEERGRWVVAIHDSPKPPPRRLTLTFPVLEAARTLVLGVFGRDKAKMAREIIENPDSQLPAARVLRSNQNSVCYLDHEAAGLLTRAT
jgi:6-phosphogluconolactonase